VLAAGSRIEDADEEAPLIGVERIDSAFVPVIEQRERRIRPLAGAIPRSHCHRRDRMPAPLPEVEQALEILEIAT